MTTAPFRRVVILRDPDAPLHYLRCAEPCQRGEWCMKMDRLPAGAPVMGCYLGGAMTESGARAIAERAGYEVVA